MEGERVRGSGRREGERVRGRAVISSHYSVIIISFSIIVFLPQAKRMLILWKSLRTTISTVTVLDREGSAPRLS